MSSAVVLHFLSLVGRINLLTPEFIRTFQPANTLQWLIVIRRPVQAYLMFPKQK